MTRFCSAAPVDVGSSSFVGSEIGEEEDGSVGVKLVLSFSASVLASRDGEDAELASPPGCLDALEWLDLEDGSGMLVPLIW